MTSNGIARSPVSYLEYALCVMFSTVASST